MNTTEPYEIFPHKIPAIIIESGVVFPTITIPLTAIKNKNAMEAIEISLDTEEQYLVLLFRVHGEILPTGTIIKLNPSMIVLDPLEGYSIDYISLKKYSVSNIIEEDGAFFVEGQFIPGPLDLDNTLSESEWTSHVQLVEQFKEKIKSYGNYYESIKSMIVSPKETDPEILVAFIAHSPLLTLDEKIDTLLEREFSKIQEKLLEIIKREDPEEVISEDLHHKLDGLDLEPESRRMINREIGRLRSMSPGSSEYHVIENYLDTIVNYPWKKISDDEKDLKIIFNKLEENHYGLDDIKKSIIDFLALNDRSDSKNGTIICLEGPPGVGKTTIAKKIAKALGRKFERISLGGMKDASELKGHRRTYVGAMAGKIVKAISKSKCENPVILLDEIDKVSAQFNKSDIDSVLLEVLDPEQNKQFQDNYMELPIDLSKVLFISTANSLSDISPPLQDRMEIIHLDSYTEEEKVIIAQKYLIPDLLKEFKIKKKDFVLTKSMIKFIVDQYTQESGVRTLRSHLKKILAHKEKCRIFNEESKVTKEVVDELLFDHFNHKEEKAKTGVGETIGMAWTPVGGCVLKIEVESVPGNGVLFMTGTLGETMRESIEIANSLIKKEFVLKEDIHIHLPAGAIPKDGPSAGVAIFIAMKSLLLNKKPKQMSMTGELSLKGKVLAVGGVKEKLIAAFNNGIRSAIIPFDNRRDIEKLPDTVKNNLKIHLVKTIKEVEKIIL
jgi:ATP-dependent Lon protease